MFVGHYGIGMALKRAETAPSLGLLFLAVQFADLLWPVFVILGIEKFSVIANYTATSPMYFEYYPFSHSLLAFLIWSALAFLFFVAVPVKFRGNKILAGIILAIAVFSHFILDLIVHVPDMPLAWGNSAKIGLGLWDHYWLSMALELILLFGGLWIYLRATRGESFLGKFGLLIVSVFLAVMQIMSTLSVPPDNPKMIAFVGLLTNLGVAGLAFWLDRKRVPRRH